MCKICAEKNEFISTNYTDCYVNCATESGINAPTQALVTMYRLNFNDYK